MKALILDEFNCLFCYCPLYVLGPDCGGNFSYTEDGVKDCSACTLPHEGDAGGRLVAEHFDEFKELGSDSLDVHDVDRGDATRDLTRSFDPSRHSAKNT